MTPGVETDDTVDGMSLGKVDEIIEKLKTREYIWKPVRRTYILKKDGKSKRALGMPGWEDKLVQEVIKMVLEAYYEPQFSDRSHGFRPQRGCHTALDTIATWKGTKWFIEGDIKNCFGGIQHDILLGILKQNIKDEAFLRLIRGMLEAGYVEDWKYHRTYSGTPQGGIVSPLMMNIVLNELDKFVEEELIPKYTKGIKRKVNPEYSKLSREIQREQRKGNWENANRLRKKYAQVPYGVTHDPHFGRLWYIRYADDTLFGLIGTKKEAEAVKQEYGNFLKSMRLEMSEEKTLITHARTGKARFLNYEIQRMAHNDKMTRQWNGKKMCRRRSVNHQLRFTIPEDVIKTWADKVMRHGKVKHRAELITLSDYDIVQSYDVQLQGVINYYNRAHNTQRLRYLRYLWETSLTKTLAAKHKTKVTTIIRKYRKYTGDRRRVVSVDVPREGKKPLPATFGKKSITREKGTIIKDDIQTVYTVRNELIARLLATSCELCGKEHVTLHGHHIRKLKDLVKKWRGKREKPIWVKQMIAIRRKTLFVCERCHKEIHSGDYDGVKLT